MILYFYNLNNLIIDNTYKINHYDYLISKRHSNKSYRFFKNPKWKSIFFLLPPCILLSLYNLVFHLKYVYTRTSTTPRRIVHHSSSTHQLPDLINHISPTANILLSLFYIAVFRIFHAHNARVPLSVIFPSKQLHDAKYSNRRRRSYDND